MEEYLNSSITYTSDLDTARHLASTAVDKNVFKENAYKVLFRLPFSMYESNSKRRETMYDGNSERYGTEYPITVSDMDCLAYLPDSVYEKQDTILFPFK